jgi:hypothetical protein
MKTGINMTEDGGQPQPKRKRAWAAFLKLMDLTLIVWIYSALAIVYYAATTDIFNVLIYPDEAWKRRGIFLAITYTILFVYYIVQDEIQSMHAWLESKTCYYKKKQEIEQTRGKLTNMLAAWFFYYDWSFCYRCVYGYFLSIAYVCQWEAYWDIFVELTPNVHWGYLVLASFAAIFVYRFLLQNRMELHCQTVPFCLIKDNLFHDYFTQFRRIKFKKVSRNLESTVFKRDFLSKFNSSKYKALSHKIRSDLL